MAELKCRLGDLVYVLPPGAPAGCQGCSPASLVGRFGECVGRVVGLACPLCGYQLVNPWEFKLQNPVYGRTLDGKVWKARMAAIEDRYLQPVRPQEDPAEVPTAQPRETAAA